MVFRTSSALAVADALAERSPAGPLVREISVLESWVGSTVAASSVSAWAAVAAVNVCGTAGKATDAVSARAKAAPEIVLNDEAR
ncbi:hypothetical protein [Glutamicibacter sp. HZAU]|uniref:hypothetical protein n=1 Tax=Glutamicibacter sp. HZAU TaxID=2049891 RepID=UPI000FFC828A|nr:hypothetical protein [Glutamicibacter sp. HZAU]RWZ83216.1 hypothetical protein EKH49_08485 [Glutamicibacter sp. HZAU]